LIGDLVLFGERCVPILEQGKKPRVLTVFAFIIEVYRHKITANQWFLAGEPVVCSSTNLQSPLNAEIKSSHQLSPQEEDEYRAILPLSTNKKNCEEHFSTI
jgi:hypothetical protein